ncbi:MAG: DUF1826 domain-containing protein [Sphingobium sp.]
MMMLAEDERRFADRTSFEDGEGAGRSFAFASRPEALGWIGRADKDLVIWRRRVEPDVAAEVAALLLDEVDDIAIASGIDICAQTLADAMTGAGYPDAPALRRDIAMLARRHAAILGDSAVRIRLEVVETDACRKFHADHVKVRTITTYLGQGTQWIEAGSPEGAGLPGGPSIRQLDEGAVAMFKGRLWQENPAIWHRSPPIGGSGEQRLLLVIDSPLAPVPVLRQGAG